MSTDLQNPRASARGAVNLLNRWLSHLIRACELGQKAHAWHQAKHLSELCPHELAALPERLKAAMLERNK